MNNKYVINTVVIMIGNRECGVKYQLIAASLGSLQMSHTEFKDESLRSSSVGHNSPNVGSVK